MVRRNRIALLCLPALGTLLAACGGSTDAGSVPQPTATVTVTETVTTLPSESSPSASTAVTEPGASTAPGDGASFGPFAAPREPGVSVVASGWTVRKSFLGPFHNGGVVLYNNGPTVGSLDVVAQASKDGQVLDRSEENLSYVPAYSWAVVDLSFTEVDDADAEIKVASVSPEEYDDAASTVTKGVSVAASMPNRRGSYVNIPIELTNHESKKFDDSALVHVVVLDSAGKIISAGNGFTSVPVGPGQTTNDVVTDVWVPRGGASVLASVDHLNFW